VPRYLVRRLCLLVLAAMLLAPRPASGQIGPGAAERHVLGPAMQIAVDPSGGWSLDEAQHADYRTDGTAIPNLGMGRSVVWIRVRLTADPADERPWYLVLRTTLVDRATLYQPRADGSHAIQEAGLGVPPAGQLSRRYVAFALAPLLEDQVVVLRIAKNGSLRLPLTLETATAYLADETWSFGVFGLLTGLLAALAVYLFAVWLALRERSHLLLSLITVALTVYTIGSTGMMYEFLPPAAVPAARIAVQLSVIAIYGLGALFVASFLELAETHRRLTRALVCAAAAFAVLAATSVVAPAAVRTILPAIGMAVLTGFLAVGFYAWWRGRPTACVFLAGWAPALVGGVVRQSLDLLALPANAVTINLVYIGAALSSLLFATALSVRLRDRDHAARRALRHSEERFRAYASAGSDWFWETDADLRFITVEGRQEAGRLVPRDLVGRLAGDLDGTASPTIRAVLEARRSFRDLVVPYHLAAGAAGYLRIAGVPLHDEAGRFVGYRGAAADVTEARRAEEARRQQDKMATLGQLAGSVAHELNNLLHPIVNFAREAKAGLSDGDARNRRFLDLVTASGHQAGEIVHQILSFARRDQPPSGSADLVSLLREAIELASAGRPGLSVAFAPAVPTAPARVTAVELGQVVGNLLTNAAQAGDRVRVEVTLDRRDAGWRLTVADDGTGIDPEALGRIFEPFFTTKASGQGTGLGLALVYDIVGHWGGRIAAENRPEGGAQFIIDIPAEAGA